MTLTAVLFFSLLSSAETSWRTFTNQAGKTFQGKVLSVDVEAAEATVQVKRTRRQAVLKFSILSEGDIEFLKEWEPDADEPDVAPTADIDLGEAKKRFYPNTKEEIADKLQEIMARPASRGIEAKQQEAVNKLNAYRYLCGVPCKVRADKGMVKEATEAAIACKKNGALSHTIGSYTDKCNLAGQGDIVDSVTSYIDDHGANNRVKRGHRIWCLNPGMSKTGFGSAGSSYSAMWALDGSTTSEKESRAYPGLGFFPKKYLHGTGWSYYLEEMAPNAKDLTVEVFKLKTRPDKAFGRTAEIPGEIVKVEYVSTYKNVINFEPEKSVHDGGIFWIRINGKGVREGYLVELY